MVNLQERNGITMSDIYGTLESIISEALRNLGNTPLAIRDSLFRGGFDGMQGAQWNCPISNYLVTILRDEMIEYLNVGDFFVSEIRDLEFSITHDVCVFSSNKYGQITWTLPVSYSDAIRKFISGFDNNKYPELIAPEVW